MVQTTTTYAAGDGLWYHHTGLMSLGMWKGSDTFLIFKIRFTSFLFFAWRLPTS